jgi:hypothetical protein
MEMKKLQKQRTQTLPLCCSEFSIQEK